MSATHPSFYGQLKQWWITDDSKPMPAVAPFSPRRGPAFTTLKRAKAGDGYAVCHVRHCAILQTNDPKLCLHARHAWSHSADMISSPEQMERRFQDPMVKVWVAYHGDHLVGYGSLSLTLHRVQALFVVPQYHNKGVGSALLSCLLQEAHHANLPKLVVESSKPAARLYARFGFKTLSRTHLHAYGHFIPVCIMERSL